MKRVIFFLCFLLLPLILSACVEIISFTVTFESNGGSAVPSVRFDGQSELILPTNPTKEGYIFDGWYMDQALQVPLVPTSFLDTPITNHIKLYAKWIEVVEGVWVTIIFDPMTDEDPVEVEVLKGSKLDSPSFSSETHIIEGWYLSDDEGETLHISWDFDLDVVEEDITLYANWVIKTFTVYFYDDDGTTLIGTSIVDYGENATPPENPNKLANEQYTYHFSGWNISLDEVTENINVFATYEAILNQYTITFKDQDETIMQTIILNYGEIIIAPEPPEKEGHTFHQWTPQFDTVKGDLTIIATYKVNTYNLTYYQEDGITVIQHVTYDYGADLSMHETPTAPHKEGYTFDGWTELPPTMPSDDVTRTATYTINTYTVTFKDADGTIIKVDTIEYMREATPPTEPSREGYTFIGWDKDYTGINQDIIVFAIYEINTYNLIYYAEDGLTVIQTTAYEYGADLSEHEEPFAPEKEGYTFDGWEVLLNTMPAHDVVRVATYTKDIIEEIIISMVQVGALGSTYTIPTGTNDGGRVDVEGGYLMATTQTTYELWYEVRIWAEAQGYHFQNKGREGNEGVIGAAPTEENKTKPVTSVSWRDVIVWSNALSEMKELNPVYRTSTGEIIKDSRNANASVVDAAIQTINNGYRLPTSMEWEMAARWRNSSGDGSILVGGRYWTPGNYASGATANYNNEAATRAVAWYWGAPGGNFARPVGQLLPNHLGIYDMSGNIYEWTFTTIYVSFRIIRGGSCYDDASFMQVGDVDFYNPSNTFDFGFRLVREQ
jgi:uncharacterized repeat protein (TIGR02543 family)